MVSNSYLCPGNISPLCSVERTWTNSGVISSFILPVTKLVTPFLKSFIWILSMKCKPNWMHYFKIEMIAKTSRKSQQKWCDWWQLVNRSQIIWAPAILAVSNVTCQKSNISKCNSDYCVHYTINCVAYTIIQVAHTINFVVLHRQLNCT